MTLTREEIQGMKPGREMDALIAEKVLGWTDIKRVNPAVIHSFSADGNHANFGFSPVLYKHVPFPLYSTDISAAWEVVTHLKSKYWYFMLSDENEGWEASFYWDPHRPAFEAVSATAPEAICKAALLAVLKL
ncbi:BC1872 family protein [Paenibacillus sp. FSL L8-0463]|uniref:BC1872 family protein n=1 Tax=Paenibacillus sp. FSL L8-0463 TaxID=2954687 RepID=UPI003119AD30